MSALEALERALLPSAYNIPMPLITSTRMQAIVVAILLVGSLATLGFNVKTAWVPRNRERAVREELRAASSRMAAEAASLKNTLSIAGPPQAVDERLGRISAAMVAAYPEVEGGFYISSLDRFSGFSHRSDGPLRRGGPVRNDPPPLESPLIRVQAQQSRNLPAGEFQLTIRDVGPSRVAVITEPVGTQRPAALCTWLMVRLVDPQALGSQVRRYQFSTGFALSGLAVSVVLAANLARFARRQGVQHRHLQDELRRTEHLAALGTLLAGVAHEVRNPLAAIRSTVQLWQRLPESSRNPESMTAVIHAVDRLNEIVTQLLVFSRVDTRTQELHDIDSLVQETLELIRSQASSQEVKIDCGLKADGVSVRGAAQSLRQVFLNIATNALQAMPGGGVLHCTSRVEAGNVVIEFSDTGRGVSAKDRDHLFEPFYSTRSEGTGLGLAICREILTQHGGSIELAPGTAPGTTFRVLLPTSRPLAS